MNIKALITTLVLGSSTMASADSFSVSASAKVSLGFNTSSAPVIVRDHRAPAPAPVVIDPCATHPVVVAPAPVYHPAVLPVTYQPPVWSGPVYLNNVRLQDGRMAMYTGWIANRPAYSRSWFDLTAPTAIIGDGHREEFDIGAQHGQFRALQLQAVGDGITKVNNIKIQFADGSQQNVLLKQQLDSGNRAISIDLTGNYQNISKIFVYGLSSKGGTYKIQAL